MAGEVVGAGGRIKFTVERTGELRLPAPPPAPLEQLADLMQRLEACGMVPILDDGLVGGNCGVAAAAAGVDGVQQGVVVSCSGKAPGAVLQAGDWVLLARFDRAAWAAQYTSAAQGAAPTSDSPLHWAALASGAAERYAWCVPPLVAVHGHVLAEGAGLEAARAAGLPISDRATLFSTPDDLEALEALFRSHPYPHHRCYIRRGHGFLLLTQSVAEAAAYVERHIAPLLTPPAADRGSGGERAGDGSGAVPPRAAARQAAADGDGAEQAAADGGGMR